MSEAPFKLPLQVYQWTDQTDDYHFVDAEWGHLGPESRAYIIAAVNEHEELLAKVAFGDYDDAFEEQGEQLARVILENERLRAALDELHDATMATTEIYPNDQIRLHARRIACEVRALLLEPKP